MGTKVKQHRLPLFALDSNIFIYYFEKNPTFGPLAKIHFQHIESGMRRGVTSIISLIELLSLRAPTEILQQLREDFFALHHLEVRIVDHEVAIEAARIRRIYGYRTPDSIQLATAKLAKADAFITNDTRLRKFKELPIVFLQKI